MRANRAVIGRIACVCVAMGWLPLAGGIAQAQDPETRYVRIAPIEQYLMDREAEIALARSAAPLPFPPKPRFSYWGERVTKRR